MRRQTVDLRFTKATFSISENKLSELKINKENTTIGFYEVPQTSSEIESGQNPSMNLQITINNLSFDYALKYKVETEPDYFDDTGAGKLSVSNMSLTMRFSVHNKNGRAQFVVNETIVDLQDYQAEMKGGHEFADGVTIVLDAFKPVFKKEILIMATRKISKLLQYEINNLIFNQPTVLPIPFSPLALNYTLIHSPYLLNHNHMAFPFDGHLIPTHLSTNEQLRRSLYQTQNLSYSCSNPNTLKIILTEDCLNSALATLHATRMLNIYDIPLIPQMIINPLVPTFKNAFGYNNQIRIVIDANDAIEAPKIEISPE